LPSGRVDVDEVVSTLIRMERTLVSSPSRVDQPIELKISNTAPTMQFMTP
jgi:hypothetical protein